MDTSHAGTGNKQLSQKGAKRNRPAFTSPAPNRPDRPTDTSGGPDFCCILCHVVNELSLRLVPDAFWEIAEPVVPEFDPRRQGGGTAPLDKRSVFTAIVYVLTSGSAWRHLPAEFGVSVPTAHRRFTRWAKAGVFGKIHRGARQARCRRRTGLVVGDLGRGQRSGKKGGTLTGPSPVDRGKPGSKLHVLSEARGTPLVVHVSAANTHDSTTLREMVKSIPAVRSRRGPRRRKPDKFRADKGYDVHLYSQVLHDWDAQRVEHLLAASFATLPPGGWLLDHDTHINADKQGPLSIAEYSVLLLHSTPGKCWSTAERADIAQQLNPTTGTRHHPQGVHNY